MSHVYEVKSEGKTETREANELACDLISKGAAEIKKRIPHAAASLDAIEQVANVMRSAAMDGVPRDVTVSILPDEEAILVTCIAKPVGRQGELQ